MKAIIFDRYLDTLGGGERYSLFLGKTLSKLGYQVELAWVNQTDLKAAEDKFGIDLNGIKINPEAYSLFFTRSGLFNRLKFTKNYDLIFWISDGSLPILFSKNTIIHFQVPFKKIGGNFILNTVKSLFYRRVVYNSKFTRDIVQPQIPLAKAAVLFPPVDTDSFKPAGMKKDVIISVARFDSPSHAKRQDVLIEAFAKIVKRNSSFKLILTGGVKGGGGESYLSSLKESAAGLPIEFIPNPDFTKLKSLYSNAKFFWHAAGYGVDERKNPEKVEHFGITTVEAMAAGCVPVVINKGGQKEIITDESGFLCDSIETMVEHTQQLINDPTLLKKFSENALIRAGHFSLGQFTNKVRSFL